MCCGPKSQIFPEQRIRNIQSKIRVFEIAVGAQQCLWELIYLFGTESWYENSEIIVHVAKPLRYVNRTDIFTLEGFGSYIFGTEENLDERGSIYPFKYFNDPGFE